MTAIKTETERARFHEYMDAQPLPLDASCKPWKPKRSNEQNAYLFGPCYKPVAEAMGYTVDEIHEYMCGRHFGWTDKRCPKTPHNPEGLASVPVRTTTTSGDGKRDVLKGKEFSDFIATVQRIAAQAGVFIPDPE